MSSKMNFPVLKQLLDCLNNNRGDVLEYNAEQQQLVPYPWYAPYSLLENLRNLSIMFLSRPLDGSLEPVHVDDFVMHHASHRFPYPACFCPVLTGSAQNIQALIRFAPNKSVEKRLVAICEKEVCGYFGMHCYWR